MKYPLIAAVFALLAVGMFVSPQIFALQAEYTEIARRLGEALRLTEAPRDTPTPQPIPPEWNRLDQFAQQQLRVDGEKTTIRIAQPQQRLGYLDMITVLMNSIGALATLVSCYFCWLTYRIRKKFDPVEDPEYN